MDKFSRKIIQETLRFLSNKGYKTITEFALPNKKRVDIIALNSKKEILIIEVKSKNNDFKNDKKWKKYLNYCNYFYFAFNKYPKNLKIFENVGIIKINNKKNEIKKKALYIKMPENKRNNIIFNFALSAASKFHRLIDPNFNNKKNNSIYIYKKKYR
tara:strand:- start:11 stop:481 length:471 start_codon:yes stop_codon:yes gene_type:complete